MGVPRGSRVAVVSRKKGLARSCPALGSDPPRPGLRPSGPRVRGTGLTTPPGLDSYQCSIHASGRFLVFAPALWCVHWSATGAVQFSCGARTRLVGDSAGAVVVAKATRPWLGVGRPVTYLMEGAHG